jgi:hypothetical protein
MTRFKTILQHNLATSVAGRLFEPIVVIAPASGGWLPTAISNLWFWTKANILSKTFCNVEGFQLNNEANTTLNLKLNTGYGLLNNADDNEFVTIPSLTLSGTVTFAGHVNLGTGLGYGIGNNVTNNIIFRNNFTTLRVPSGTVTWLYSVTAGEHHVIITRNSSNQFIMYIDGVSVGVGDNVRADSFSFIYFGRRENSTSFEYSGIMKDWYFLDTDYTAEEALYHFNNPQNPVPSRVTTGEKLRCYKFNQGKYENNDLVIETYNEQHGIFTTSGADASTNGLSYGYQQALAACNTYGRSTITGTWSGAGTTLTGSGGAATTDLQVFDYIRSGREFRQVTAINSDDEIEISSAFTTAPIASSLILYDTTVKTNKVIIDAYEYNASADILGRTMTDFPFIQGMLNFIGDNADGAEQTEPINLGNTKSVMGLLRVRDASVDQTIFETSGANVIALTSSALVAAEFDSVEINMDGNTALDWSLMFFYISSTTDVNLSAFAVDETFDGQLIFLAAGDELTIVEQEELWNYLTETQING